MLQRYIHINLFNKVYKNILHRFWDLLEISSEINCNTPRRLNKAAGINFSKQYCARQAVVLDE